MKTECDFAEYKDEELVQLAQQGDDAAQEYLLNKYKSLVRAKSRAYFLIGADTERFAILMRRKMRHSAALRSFA